MKQKSKIAEFDLQVSSLRKSLNQAATSYSPSEVKEIVFAIFTGKNYRSITELPTRQSISVYSGWTINLVHRAKLKYAEKWKENLLELTSRKGASKEEKWLRVWLLGLTQKTAVNLGIKASKYNDYLQIVEKSTDEAVKNMIWQPSTIELSNATAEKISLSPSDSIWLLQIAGAAVLTIRGSKKSSAGKRLEKAIARAALTVLGLSEENHFWLNIERDQEVDREIDAEITTKRGRIRIDIALIGTGNQEVSEDKLGRVGKNGIVVVDILGAKSQVKINAARHEVKVIQLRNNLALSELYSYLEPLMPNDVNLRKPPTDANKLKEIFKKLPDTVFSLPKND